MYVSIKFIIIISHLLVLLTVTMAIRPGVLFDVLGPSDCNAGIGSLRHEVPVTMVSMSNEKIFVTSFWLTLEK